MDVTPLVKEGAQIIQSYADGGFRVSGRSYDGPVLVHVGTTQSWLPSANKVSGLGKEDFQSLIDMADEIDVVLLGAGAQVEHVKPALKNALREAGLSVDVMDTGAACRTFNVLMAEGRRVVAALLTLD